MSCTCTATVYCDTCCAEDDAAMAASGMDHCWVCDALAPVLTNENGEVTGTTCGCDDYGYTDGADGVWR